MQPDEHGIGRLRRASARLEALIAAVSSGGGSREEAARIVAEISGATRHPFGPRPRARRGHGARKRILDYLVEHVGQEVSGEELAAVSEIQEWARRVRELRDESGYEITELGGSVYRLESVKPNEGRAAQWQLANSIRRQPGSALDRIKSYLKAQVAEVVTRDQIARKLAATNDNRGRRHRDHLRKAPAQRKRALVRRYPEDFGAASSARGGSGTMFRADYVFTPGPPEAAASRSCGRRRRR